MPAEALCSVAPVAAVSHGYEQVDDDTLEEGGAVVEDAGEEVGAERVLQREDSRLYLLLRGSLQEQL